MSACAGVSSRPRCGPASYFRDIAAAPAKQFQAHRDDLKAEARRDFPDEVFVRLVVKLSHFTIFGVNQMVMQFPFGGLVASAAVAEIVALQDASSFEQPDGSINRGDRDVTIQRDSSPIQFFNVGVIRRFGEYEGDDSALPGQAQPLFGT